MSWRTRFFMLAALVFSALLVLPGVTHAAPRQTALRNNTTTVSLAFTGLITSGANSGTALTGGLTIGIRSDGFFNGNFHLPDGTQISVSGRVRSNGKLNITFYTSSGQPFITGQGRLNAAGEYVGPFQVYSGGKQVAWGIWSALPVASPDKVLALAFVGTTTKGPDAGVSYSGAIVLNSSTLVGTMNLPNGAIVGVTGTLLSNGHIKVVFDLGDGAKITGYGKPTENPANGLDKGFKGPFYGPVSGDMGRWVAYFFNF